ncbi:hypothetical protein RB11190 [Rhodopirellula baltica SH 1]|uniref:Uncharacterized protein n=2 Tax=Rhodopirellula baltica TaxID=265606 RepID=Q7UEQ8_RHOBA|nr:hypothetical protein RB11190 [Rhodopirellula baltica SH 1]
MIEISHGARRQRNGNNITSPFVILKIRASITRSHRERHAMLLFVTPPLNPTCPNSRPILHRSIRFDADVVTGLFTDRFAGCFHAPRPAVP